MDADVPRLIPSETVFILMLVNFKRSLSKRGHQLSLLALAS